MRMLQSSLENKRSMSDSTSTPTPRRAPEDALLDVLWDWAARVPALLAELGLIALWVLWLSREILDLNPRLISLGREYLHLLQYNYFWNLLPECGACVLWNGTMNGGAPAFIDIHSASLHPLTILFTLALGVINGGKALFAASVFLAGLAQWWLARAMSLGRLPRLWAAGIAAAGTHLFGRMETGNVPLVLSTACAALVIAAAVDLALNRRRQGVALLAGMLASLFLAGQGYLQLGVFLAVLPALGLFILQDWRAPDALWKDIGLAGLLGVLMAAYLLLPFARFAPNFTKLTDPLMSEYQTLEYLPLNLVIRDLAFYDTDLLSKTTNTYQHLNYIGWIPVLMGLLAVRFAPREKSRLLGFLLLGLALVFLVSSKEFYEKLYPIIPQVEVVRFGMLIAGLAIPFVVALAAWGADLVMQKDLGSVGLDIQGRSFGRATVTGALMVILFVMSLFQAARFTTHFTTLVELDVSAEALDALETESSQWVQPPYGEFFWLDDAFNRGYKVALVYWPWNWDGREEPRPYRELNRSAEAVNEEGYIASVDEDTLHVKEHPTNEYARVVIPAGDDVPCTARARGGSIDAVCHTETGGKLVVAENSWGGWRATVDGERARLNKDDWLSVDLEPGAHSIHFSYLPWDVPLGLLLTFIGIGLTVYYTRRKK
jgi:hypothetical protein